VSSDPGTSALNCERGTFDDPACQRRGDGHTKPGESRRSLSSKRLPSPVTMKSREDGREQRDEHPIVVYTGSRVGSTQRACSAGVADRSVSFSDQ
jgi:hypothetical protein